VRLRPASSLPQLETSRLFGTNGARSGLPTQTQRRFRVPSGCCPDGTSSDSPAFALSSFANLAGLLFSCRSTSISTRHATNASCSSSEPEPEITYLVRNAEVSLCSPFWPRSPHFGTCGAHFVGMNAPHIPWNYYDRPADLWLDEHWQKVRPLLYEKAGLRIPHPALDSLPISA